MERLLPGTLKDNLGVIYHIGGFNVVHRPSKVLEMYRTASSIGCLGDTRQLSAKVR